MRVVLIRQEEFVLKIPALFRITYVLFVFVVFTAAALTAWGSSTLFAAERLPELKTRAEATGFKETTGYDETIDFIRQLQRESSWIRLEQFGETARGRPLYVVVLSRDGLFTPAAAAASGKPVVLISNGIHAGEICGKEATLMLLREMVRGELGHLLDDMVLLVVPVFNVDGHDMVSKYNRLNQNGPERGMGSRANALGYDLNRDFMKLETPEVQAWVGNLFTRWWPHLTIDVHTTDGYDHRYTLTYLYDRHPMMPRVLESTLSAMMDNVEPRMREAGLPIQVYGSFLDKAHPEQGFRIWPPYPRLCTSYAATHGRLGLLSEAHAHKDFHTRVEATRSFLKFVLQYVQDNGKSITDAVSEASLELIRRGGEFSEEDRVVLTMDSEARETSPTITIEGWELNVEKDVRTRMECLTYTRNAKDYTVPLLDSMVVTGSVARPVIYLIPPEYGTIAVDLLLRHGVRVERAVEPFSARVEVYHVEDLSFEETLYQGHLRAVTEILPPKVVEMEYPVGTFFVPMDQPPGEIAALILEPGGIDGLIAWNRMNNLTTDPKVKEQWVLANLGREMMDDSETANAFNARAESDPNFLEDERAKALFFWERSAYPTPGVGDYPITRLFTRPAVTTETVGP